mmetsp:Transcript_588/g.829  ORF Transcript_588/g.829 Transcript_588/m.829 type:complete len:229 (-) Transcript_588:113-799(-)
MSFNIPVIGGNSICVSKPEMPILPRKRVRFASKLASIALVESFKSIPNKSCLWYVRDDYQSFARAEMHRKGFSRLLRTRKRSRDTLVSDRSACAESLYDPIVASQKHPEMQKCGKVQRQITPPACPVQVPSIEAYPSLEKKLSAAMQYRGGEQQLSVVPLTVPCPNFSVETETLPLKKRCKMWSENEDRRCGLAMQMQGRRDPLVSLESVRRQVPALVPSLMPTISVP